MLLPTHLTDGGLHVELLQHRVHVAGCACIAQSHEAALRSADDRRVELDGEKMNTPTQFGGVLHSTHVWSPFSNILLKYTELYKKYIELCKEYTESYKSTQNWAVSEK